MRKLTGEGLYSALARLPGLEEQPRGGRPPLFPPSAYRDVIRAKIVLLAAQGLSNDIIATRLDTPRQIVSKWRKRLG